MLNPTVDILQMLYTTLWLVSHQDLMILTPAPFRRTPSTIEAVASGERWYLQDAMWRNSKALFNMWLGARQGGLCQDLWASQTFFFG